MKLGEKIDLGFALFFMAVGMFNLVVGGVTFSNNNSIIEWVLTLAGGVILGWVSTKVDKREHPK